MLAMKLFSAQTYSAENIFSFQGSLQTNYYILVTDLLQQIPLSVMVILDIWNIQRHSLIN